MKTTVELLEKNSRVSGYKINIHTKESCELFFVKGKLETVRHTDTCDKEVSVYVKHDEFVGDSQFLIYPSTTEEEIAKLIDEAVDKALLINNKSYELPEAEQGEYEVESNFKGYAPMELAAEIAEAVFEANTLEKGSLNSVEIFINKHTEEVINSKGLCKKQIKYDAMVEAIPTYNGETQSVELYEQYNFSNFDRQETVAEIAGKMKEVEARYNAVKPDDTIDCKVILDKLELANLFFEIAYDLNYSSVYSHSNLYNKGDDIQKEPSGDLIGITMAGQAKGSIRSSMFDADGMALGSVRLVDGGKAVNYFGSNRYGQYLDEKPTGMLPCLCADSGTADEKEFSSGKYLEVISMSGLQVDFYNDYIGGEVRLAYYNDGEKTIPVTGISIAGKLSDTLNTIRFSTEAAVHNGYIGPKKAILSNMKVF